ncbi:MAG: septal ring lytic transglycosylase RlpA family protein [Chitinophagales bacterium]|nr:septal ring lytic transglycosylase RlpA family protein [Chitinophagaceae bacterium]MCB9064759.1 septal ring lytic transglycosylase RlpA family protein [Chitinophagales bacterium]
MKLIFTSLLVLLFSNAVFAQEDVENVNGRLITDDAVAKGVASYYHDKFVGRPTSTGEVFSNDKYTAASNTLSLNTYVKVTNLDNGKVLYVRINDRMNKSNKRLIDMASICARKLGYHYQGLAKVKVEVVSKEEGKRGILAQRAADAERSEQPENKL